MASTTPKNQRKRLTNDERGSEETFLAIQAMERTLLEKKMEENSKQTKITDAFSINSMTLH